jgi:hypothetical protein
MEQIIVPEQNTRLNKVNIDSAATSYGLNVVVVYEDAETRNWAREVYDRATGVSGPENTSTTWWKIDELSTPAVLAGAISTAMRADVIIIAARATEALPMSFYVWAENWMPHRHPATGALIALLASPETGNAEQARFRQYLRSVARQGRMDLMLEDRESSQAVRSGKPGKADCKRIFRFRPQLCSSDFLSVAFAS